jgi:hypothetical protein
VNTVYEHDFGPLWTRVGYRWTEEPAKLSAREGSNSDFFGYAVAISGDVVVVGAEVGAVCTYTEPFLQAY